ncbi:TIGR04076 family protein [Anaeropeptidivorans aminofermentans]|uniref:TIGR04076 family protein n=1 Tax=Anaeropeptidivorans aminofermentans TaxID=2934315 RepID=UPI002023D2F4|nr:TIGR04076 family protein [Anaeropeptidivorans aminofermentans]MBE6011660.1 TIGR04076 family protein [Lachnospiraceae bacterium]
MSRIKITVVESKCRSGYHKKGDCFIIEDLCPPLCHELWNCAYPSVYALQNGAILDYGNGKASIFDVKCPDGGRVIIHGELIDDQNSIYKNK